MKNMFFKLLVSMILFSGSILALDNNERYNQVQSFVERFYQNVLDRHSDEAGLNDWTNQLLSGTKTGADIAKGFIFSQEFSNRNTTNEEYLTILYKAFFNREPDSGGFNDWLSKLNNNLSRSNLLDGFLYSQEFSDLCKVYNIKPVSTTNITKPIKGVDLTLDSINIIKSSSSYNYFLGKIINNGNDIATYIKITFTFYDSNKKVIDTSFCYVKGYLYKSDDGFTYESALGQGEDGYFECLVDNKKKYSSYDYKISHSEYNKKFSKIGAIKVDVNPMVSNTNTQKFLGTLTNNSNETLSFVNIYFISKDKDGKPIDISFTYVNGSSCNGDSDSCLTPLEIGSYEVDTLIPNDKVKDYEYRVYYMIEK